MSEAKQWSAKYRSKTLKDIIGNSAAKKEVASVIKKQDAHCILFHGPSGCGKTSMAYIVAKSFATKTGDIVKHNVGSEGGIDDIRALVRQAKFMPQGAYKVILLEEAHKLTGASRDAVLQPIEEPPHDRLIWVLSTDQPWLLQKAILDRCKSIEVGPPTEEELSVLLLHIMEQEPEFKAIKKTAHRERIALEVARAARCVPRAAVQLLHSVSSKLDDEDLNIKSLIVNSIRKSAEATLDKAALQMVMAIHSREKDAAFRAQYMMAQIGMHAIIALLGRMIYINHCLMMDAGGVRVPAAYYHKKELEPRKAIPSLIDATKAAIFLSDLRQSLEVINIDPAHLIIPKLISYIMSTETRNKDDD